MDNYKKAGIADVDSFYRDKFLTNDPFDSLGAGQDFRHNINHAKSHWVFANTPSGSKVLDIGCGCGNLHILAAKGCEVTGVDISQPNCDEAVKRGYKQALCCDGVSLPFPDNSFDVTVSMDVLGHIRFEDKNKFIAEIKRTLKPGGVTLHGIECDPVNYATMSDEDLKTFVEVDGHVGMEGQKENGERFLKYFGHVKSQFQYNIAMPHEEIKKQHDMYPTKFQADPYLLNRLTRFSAEQAEAWDIAMGFVFERIMKFNPAVKDHWGFLFLRASDSELKSDKYGSPDVTEWLKPVSFGSGGDQYNLSGKFHEREGDGSLENSFRWTGGSVEIIVPTAGEYRLMIATTRPVQAPRISVEFFIERELIASINEAHERYTVILPNKNRSNSPTTTLAIHSNVFNPKNIGISGDDRDLGLQLFWIDWEE